MRFDIAGHKCEGFLCQQYWHDGKLVDEANVLFLKIESQLWHRICFDCGVLFWRQEKEPRVPPTQDKYDYPLVDLAVKYALNGRRVEKVWQSSVPAAGELGLVFEGGTEITIRNSNDHSILEIRAL